MADKVSYIIEEIVVRMPEVAAAGGRRYGTALGLSLSTASSISFPFLQNNAVENPQAVDKLIQSMRSVS